MNVPPVRGGIVIGWLSFQGMEPSGTYQRATPLAINPRPIRGGISISSLVALTYQGMNPLAMTSLQSKSPELELARRVGVAENGSMRWL